jgi:hypothetical protein
VLDVFGSNRDDISTLDNWNSTRDGNSISKHDY